MKKIFILIILLSITGCTTKEKNNPINIEKEKLEINVETESYIDKNEVKVGLYENKKLIKEYNTTLNNHKEITVFNVYYTNEETLENSNIKYNWNKYYNNYTNIDKHKIGFYITFNVENKKIERTIINPYSTHAMDPYLYVYLYDDIHQPEGAWYSHLEPEDMKENTIFSSIKLYLAGEGNKITSDITLTVFTYDTEDDFDEFNQYRGNSKYTATIKTK